MESNMHYVITDGHGYLAGKRLYRGRDKRVISMWSSKRSDAMRIHFFDAADYLVRAIGAPGLSIKRL